MTPNFFNHFFSLKTNALIYESHKFPFYIFPLTKNKEIDSSLFQLVNSVCTLNCFINPKHQKRSDPNFSYRLSICKQLFILDICRPIIIFNSLFNDTNQMNREQNQSNLPRNGQQFAYSRFDYNHFSRNNKNNLLCPKLFRLNTKIETHYQLHLAAHLALS